MTALSTLLITIGTIIISFIIAALPLHITVILFGGKTNILKTIFVNIISGLIVGVINVVFNSATGLISFLIIILIYREMFRLKWYKTIIVWFIQGIIIYLIYLLLGLLFFTAILII